MKTTAMTAGDLAASVIAVPPLCRDANLEVVAEENRKLIQYIEAGGVRTLLYGGNANFYNIALSEYAGVLDLLEASAGEDTHLVPAVGPFYGTMMDQVALLKGRNFPAAMVLPAAFPLKISGVQTAIRKFAEASGLRVVLYIKNEGYTTPEAAKELVDDGIISWIKYAIVRERPEKDQFLAELIDLVDPAIIVSGIGEQPAIVHMRDFGLQGFTSGCVCVDPKSSMDMLKAIQAEDYDDAELIRHTFRPLEDLRNEHGPIPVLHHAVTLAQIAETGPLFPLLDAMDDGLLDEIRHEARILVE